MGAYLEGFFGGGSAKIANSEIAMEKVLEEEIEKGSFVTGFFESSNEYEEITFQNVQAIAPHKDNKIFACKSGSYHYGTLGGYQEEGFTELQKLEYTYTNFSTHTHAKHIRDDLFVVSHGVKSSTSTSVYGVLIRLVRANDEGISILDEYCTEEDGVAKNTSYEAWIEILDDYKFAVGFTGGVVDDSTKYKPFTFIGDTHSEVLTIGNILMTDTTGKSMCSTKVILHKLAEGFYAFIRNHYNNGTMLIDVMKYDSTTVSLHSSIGEGSITYDIDPLYAMKAHGRLYIYGGRSSAGCMSVYDINEDNTLTPYEHIYLYSNSIRSAVLVDAYEKIFALWESTDNYWNSSFIDYSTHAYEKAYSQSSKQDHAVNDGIELEDCIVFKYVTTRFKKVKGIKRYNGVDLIGFTNKTGTIGEKVEVTKATW